MNCQVEGCDKQHKAKGMCNTHYERQRLNRQPKALRKPCSVDGCETLAQGRGLCKTHWARWKSNGDPNVTQRDYGTYRINLHNGYVGVWAPGHPQAYDYGYALEHRYVMHELGYELNGMEVHHIDHDRKNNNPSNLMVLTPDQHKAIHAQGLVR